MRAEREHDQNQREAGDAAARFEHQQHDDGSDNDAAERAGDELDDQLRIAGGDIEAGQQAQDRQHDVDQAGLFLLSLQNLGDDRFLADELGAEAER